MLRGYEPETARIWETKPHAAASNWVPCVIMVNGASCAVRALEDNATYTGVKRESLRMRIVKPLALDGRVSKMRLAAIAKLASALTDNFVHDRSEDLFSSAPPTHLSFEEAVLLAPLIRHALVNAAARVTAVPFEERVAMTLNDRRLLQWRWFLRFLNASYAPELCLRRDSGHALAACLLRDAEAGLILHVQVGTPANTYESLLERLAETVGFDRPTIGLLCRAVGCRCICSSPCSAPPSRWPSCASSSRAFGSRSRPQTRTADSTGTSCTTSNTSKSCKGTSTFRPREEGRCRR